MSSRLLVTLHPAVLLLLLGAGKALIVTRCFTPAPGVMANVHVETRLIFKLTVACMEIC